MEKINQYSLDSDILIIDDNSPDGTSIILSELKSENSNLKFLTRQSKLGLDTAHKYAYDLSEDKSDWKKFKDLLAVKILIGMYMKIYAKL